MSSYTVWDRVSPINGVPVEEVLKDPFFDDEEEVLLIQYYADSTYICPVVKRKDLLQLFKADESISNDELVARYCARVLDSIEQNK